LSRIAIGRKRADVEIVRIAIEMNGIALGRLLDVDREDVDRRPSYLDRERAEASRDSRVLGPHASSPERK
jgi:hypothetical protein